MRLLCLSALALFATAAAAEDPPAVPAPPPPAAPAPPPVAPAPPAAPATPPATPAPDAVTPPATPPPAQGMLSIASEPTGAKLFLDGADTGLSTPVVDFPVAPGAHTVKLVGADGRELSTEFTLEAGGSLNLNLTLPEPAPVAPPPPPEVTPPPPPPPPAAPEAPAPSLAPEQWTWMTVAGWTGLGLGTIGLLSGAVVLTTPSDMDAGTLGFGLFGTGVGLVIGGGVLLYLDTELADAQAAPAAPAR
ncbi:MAG: PEGA domain-containing protein [Deltaproteobacteria bacterium]|nr:PEGA domain-containing protein [Deltaproteobacteria bacterium]